MRKREATTAEIRERFESDKALVSESRLTCPNGADYYVMTSILLNRIENLERRASFWETNYKASEEAIVAIQHALDFYVEAKGTVLLRDILQDLIKAHTDA